MMEAPKNSEALSMALRRRIHPIGSALSDGFHFLGLFAIGGATVWAAAKAFMDIAAKGQPTIEDLLLLFIYLEIGSMVGVYFKTNHMPLRFVVYIAITAVTRHLIGYVSHLVQPDVGILILAGAILILASAVLIIRFASYHYGSSPGISAADAQLADSDSEARSK